MGDSYMDSKVAFLCGPIEYWWNTQDDPHRFNSFPAAMYRIHRDKVRDTLVRHNFLVYSPHGAFKGPWNERMQGLNDYALERSDVVINMSPPHIPGKGTAHETAYAIELGIPVVMWAPKDDFDACLTEVKRVC